MNWGTTGWPPDLLFPLNFYGKIPTETDTQIRLQQLQLEQALDFHLTLVCWALVYHVGGSQPLWFGAVLEASQYAGEAPDVCLFYREAFTCRAFLVLQNGQELFICAGLKSPKQNPHSPWKEQSGFVKASATWPCFDF